MVLVNIFSKFSSSRSQPLLSQHWRYIVPTSKYPSIVAFPNIWQLLVMATCQSQPLSTVSLIYEKPLGFRSCHISKCEGLGGPIPSFIGGCYVRFSMVDLPLFDVRSKIVGCGDGSLYSCMWRVLPRDTGHADTAVQCMH
jgi:hypothetical protein